MGIRQRIDVRLLRGRVVALSLPAIQLLAKSEFPNGFEPSRPVRCGIDPALNLCSKAALLEGSVPLPDCWPASAGAGNVYGANMGTLGLVGLLVAFFVR